MPETRDELDTIIPIQEYDELDSTSREARRDVQSGELGDQGRMYVAKRQTSGLGRFGRAWASPEGGLWSTLAWPVNLEPAKVLDGLGLRVGMAVVHTVEHALAAHGHGEPVQLKWPNDVMVKGKKIAGCLIEVVEKAGKTYVLAGVGVNANFAVDALPQELRAGATTMQEIVRGPSPLPRIARDLRRRLRDALMTEGLDRKTLVEARQRLFGVGREARVALADGSEVRGELLGLDDAGCPRLKTNKGEFTAPRGAALVV